MLSQTKYFLCPSKSCSIVRISSFINNLFSRKASSFQYSDLVINESKVKQPKPSGEIIFGSQFTDHMFTAKWNDKDGWSKPSIDMTQYITIHPAAKTLNYAIGVYEGLKCHKGVDQCLRLFRPDLHIQRFRDSCKRAMLPEFEPKELILCLKELLRLDRSWAPTDIGTFLYIRPVIFGDEPILGIGKSATASLHIIISPCGAYYKSASSTGVSLYVDPQFTRSWPGGTGAYKLSANYAPTMYIQEIAKGKGCDNVLWLFGNEELVTEVGTMNVFVYWTNENGEKQLCTPKADGLILPGITRKSILELTKSWGEFSVIERNITMPEIVKAINENRVHNMFGSGTATVITPIGKLLYKDKWYTIPGVQSDTSIAKRILEAITDIQYCREGPHPWMHAIDE